MEPEECLAEFLAQVEGVWADLVLENFHNFLQRLDQFIVVDIIDQFQVDADYL